VFFQRTFLTLKIIIFFFQLKAFQLKEKISFVLLEGHRSAIPSASIFVRVFVADALAAHAGFCICIY
jgi:hypothetical protein